MNFQEAIKLMEQGKKVRLPDFDKNEYIYLRGGSIPKYYNCNKQDWEYFHFDIRDFKSNNWEEYKEL